MAQGIDLSFLPEQEQIWVLNAVNELKCSISMAQSARIKELSKASELTEVAIKLILTEARPKTKKIVLKAEKIAEYFPEEMSDKEIEETIIGLLEEWKSKKK
ncbi:MAG: hypothetical protein K5894_14845 [Lachnospiraceae bacterium]|nr:hypothetical protein [Lachnospiraceae bacterium]